MLFQNILEYYKSIQLPYVLLPMKCSIFFILDQNPFPCIQCTNRLRVRNLKLQYETHQLEQENTNNYLGLKNVNVPSNFEEFYPFCSLSLRDFEPKKPKIVTKQIFTYQTCQNHKNMKNTKIDRGDLRSIIMNHYDMVLVAMVEEIVAFLIEKMVVDDKGARWEPMVRLRMKERYIEKSDFDADEELLW